MITAPALFMPPVPRYVVILNRVHRASVRYGLVVLKQVTVLPIHKTMDPIRGTDMSFAMARIAIDSTSQPDNVETGAMKMSLDTMRDAGQQLVELLETLGRNINTYA